jgi:uncharacterized protein
MTMPIPIYPAARPLEIADKALLQNHFFVLQPLISELCFANLFLFRHLHQYTVTIAADSLVIFGCGYDGMPYFLPPLSGKRGETARRLLQEGHSLYGADEQFIADNLTGGGFTVAEDRNSDDYLYLRSDLAELPGNRFHKKKNRINYFAARHRYSVEAFSEQHLPGALQLLAEWQRVRGDVANRSLAAETAATREGLELADQLGLSGVVILTAGKVAAFALGEQLNATTTVCHFEKADPFLEGLAQLVNREFSRSQFPECLYINREQDLGESGLREAKRSYHPVGMVRKFRVASS